MKINRSFIVFIILSFMCFSLYAGENLSNEPTNVPVTKVNELNIQIGYFPYYETVLHGLLTFGTDGFFIPLPAITVDYLRNLNSKNAIGVSSTFVYPFIYVGGEHASFGNISTRFLYRRIYSSWEKIKLYGSAALGLELIFASISSYVIPFFSYSVSPIGMWFGSEDLFGTAELTMGTKGTALTLGIGWCY